MIYEKKEVESLLHECIAKLSSLGKEFRVDFNINKTLKIIAEIMTRPTSEREFEFRLFQTKFEGKYGVQARVTFCQLIIFSLFYENVEKIDNQNLPKGVVEYLKEDFLRALRIAKEGNEKKLTVENSIFIIYVEELSFNRFPIGNQSVNVAGFSRSLISLQSPTNMVKFLCAVYSCGGNYPLYELHYNPHRFRNFNPEGWQNVMGLGAGLLRLRPGIKGIFGGAWFFDPSLTSISPELAYLRELVLDVGGMIFFAGKGTQHRKDSFAMSKVRKTAFEEGRYDPAGYMAIIPRKALLSYFKL